MSFHAIITTSATGLTVAAILLNLAVVLFSFRLREKTQPNSSCYCMVQLPRLGWFLVILRIMGLWIVLGQPPLANMHHVLLVLAACFYPAYELLRWRIRTPQHTLPATASPIFCAACALVLAGTLFMNEGLDWQRPPALQSAWFIPHVLSYMLAYSLCAAAALSGLIARIHPAAATRISSSTMITEMIRLAVPFLTIGLATGALWAEAAWGDYWQWDAKEVWALITWLLYLTHLHANHHPITRRFRGWLHTAAFLSLLTTFLIVNAGIVERITSILHRYG